MNQLKKEIVHFTHTDADALGCALVLDYATPNTKKITYHTNYQNIREKTQEVLDYIHQYSPSLLVISDISFASEKHELLLLQEINNKTDTKVILFEHHEYDEGFFNDITINYIHDKSKCATLIMRDYFKVENKHLNNLCQIINSFDIWQEHNPLFPVGLGFDNWFWNEHKSKNKSIEQIAHEIAENGYTLPKDFKNYFQEYTKAFTNKLQNLKDRQLFIDDGFIALVFTDEYFNEALHESFSKNGNKVALIVNSYGIIRIRFSTVEPLSIDTKEKIKIGILGKLDHGHLNAFSIKIDNSNFEKIMAKVQELTAIINKHKPQ